MKATIRSANQIGASFKERGYKREHEHEGPRNQHPAGIACRHFRALHRSRALCLTIRARMSGGPSRRDLLPRRRRAGTGRPLDEAGRLVRSIMERHMDRCRRRQLKEGTHEESPSMVRTWRCGNACFFPHAFLYCCSNCARRDTSRPHWGNA